MRKFPSLFLFFALALNHGILFAEIASPYESTHGNSEGTPAALPANVTARESALFNIDMPAKPYDVEDTHVWAASKFVNALTAPAASEEDFVNSLWLYGQQIAALQRQDKIYLNANSAPKWASFVFDTEVKRQLGTFCKTQADAKVCLKSLTEKAMKISEIFWKTFKDKTVDDFKKNGLDPTRANFDHIRGHILDAFRDPNSDAWKAINDYMSELKTRGLKIQDGSHDQRKVYDAPAVPLDSDKPVVDHGLGSKTRVAIKDIKGLLDFHKRPIEKVEEERMPADYVTDQSGSYDISRAASRYATQSVISLGCSHFREASVFNGQLIARLVRKGNVTSASLTEMTNSSVKNWCYSQFSRATEINKCQETITPLFAQLNQYYWNKVKDDLSADKRNPTTADVDAYFKDLKEKDTLKKNPDHPLSKIYAAFDDALGKLKSDWNYKCLGDKDEATGEYRSIKASGAAKTIAGNLLQHLTKNPLRDPPAMCARAIKTGMTSAGVFNSYPDWGNAKQMDAGFQYENAHHVHLASGYELKKLDTLDPASAPPYAVIVYGGSGNGHVEQKVPTADLKAVGISEILGFGHKKISVDSQDYAYVSDYIDAAPRSSLQSRLSAGKGGGSTDNGRPVLGIFVIMRTN